MGSYIQMGHHSKNLLEEGGLPLFNGAILSPVNETEESLGQQIIDHQTDDFEMIFDPQLYYPNSDRGHLPNWGHFPGDFDTADHSSHSWWDELNNSLVDIVEDISPSSVCSPAFVPKNFSDSYYEMINWVGENLKNKLEELDIEMLLTTIVRMSDLTDSHRCAEIASLITSSNIERCYLVLLSNTEPRKELSDTEDLKGAMKLIKYLSESGLNILMGFCSSDILLWKTAGVHDCASGKYFNLRRFTPSRWEPPQKGGGQIPYWFEESVMAYLREADLQRLRSFTSLSANNNKNPFCKSILELIDRGMGESWLALSWRQYLYWFADFEQRLNSGKIEPNSMLRHSEQLWRNLDENNILFDEINNDGSWIRRWRKAIVEFDKD